jgi:hypothetical protein
VVHFRIKDGHLTDCPEQPSGEALDRSALRAIQTNHSAASYQYGKVAGVRFF